jgi:hypothetical protein
MARMLAAQSGIDGFQPRSLAALSFVTRIEVVITA